MKIAAAVLFSVCVLLTILLIKEDLEVAGNYTGWGVPNMTKVITVVFWRWVVMSAAFIALLASGRLSAWAPWAPLRVFVALGGVLVFECSSFFLHFVFADENVYQRYRIIFAVLATALPFCVMAGGFFSIRSLFLVGVGAAMVCGIYGNAGETTFMHKKRPFLGTDSANRSLRSVLGSAGPMYDADQRKEVFDWIEKRPYWTTQVAKELDGPEHLSAMYVLCRHPGRLDEALQERCWVALGAATVELDKDREKSAGLVIVSEALKLAEALRGLSALEGPVRDRHRAEFLAAMAYLDLARPHSSLIPDTATWDWMAK